MQEQFANYEIALKLKELGFNEECFGWFSTIPNELQEDGDNTEHVNIAFPWDTEKALNDGYNYILKAPLWQQVIDFLRVKWNIIIEINTHNYCDTFANSHSYESRCKKYKNNEIERTHIVRNTKDNNNHIFYNYNKCREQSILKAIELCKNQK